jgi:hypothetical protein
MPRMALIALLALLLAAPAATAQSTRTKILRECQNGRLSGDYTASQIRDARNNIPDDLDQYSDCRDVLTRALLDQAGGGSPTGGGGGGGGAGGTGGGTLGGRSGGGGAGDDGQPLTPSTNADRKALQKAAGAGAQPVAVAGRHITPGEGVRNDLPPTLIVVLVLLAVAAVVAATPFARRGFVSLGGPLRRVIPGRSG